MLTPESQSEVQKQYQLYYFKLLQVAELLENEKWDDFCREYTKCSAFFRKLDINTKEINEFNTHLTEKIQRLLSYLTTKITEQKNSSLDAFARIKSIKKSLSVYGTR